MPLFFEESSSKEGFTNLETSDDHSSPEPVVRELLQNSLDAYEKLVSDTQNRGKLNVVFAIENIRTDQIPGIEKYEEAFSQGCKFRGEDSGVDEARIRKEIESEIESPESKVLLCIDNGIGIAEDTMESVLWQGNTSKTGGSERGSFGVGHMMTFRASKLRYVIYGGQYKEGEKIKQICGGSCILAAHPDIETEEGRSERGYYVKKLTKNFNEQHKYVESPPEPIRKHLDSMNNKTGSVVAIFGFNNFYLDSEEEAIQSIITSAAKNFFPAIVEGDMSVTAKTSSEQKIVLDETTIEDTLYSVKDEKTTITGFLPGRKAYNSYLTYTKGIKIESEYAEIFAREQNEGEGGKKHEINDFRNGMWITNDIPNTFLNKAFSDTKRFNMWMQPKPHTEYYNLIKKCEGPEHRSIDNYKKIESGEKKAIKKYMSKIFEAVAEQIGSPQSTDEWSPANFAMLEKGQEVSAVKTPTPLPRPEPNPDIHPIPQPDPPSPIPQPDPPPGPSTKIPKGSKMPVSVSQRTANINPLIIRASAQYRDSENNLEYVRISVREEFYSDPSCESYETPSYLKIDKIETCGGEVHFPVLDDIEITIPAEQMNDMTIHISGNGRYYNGIPLKVETRKGKQMPLTGAGHEVEVPS